MPRYLVTDFFRERPGATGAAGATVQYYDQADGAVGSSTVSDADGKFNLLDEVYPGLGYYTATKDGITKRHEAASIGFIGTLSAADLITLFDGSFSNGILFGIGNGFALSAGGGLNIACASGGGVIDGHPFRFSSSVTLAVGANGGGTSRIDRVVAYLYPPGSATGNPGAIGRKVVAGTTSAPALVNTADEVQISLGTYTVAPGAGAPSAITSEAARSIPGIHSHVMADVTDLAAALALLAPKANPTFTGTVDAVNLDVSGTVVIGGNDLTAELGFLNAVTSAIQTQIGLKANAASPVFTGTPTFPDGSIPQVDVANLTTDLAARAALAGATFTGPVAVNSELLVDVDSQNAFIIRQADNDEVVRVDTVNMSLNMFRGLDLVVLSDGSTEVARIDGATGSISSDGDATFDGDLTVGNSDDDIHSFRGSLYSFGTTPGISQGTGNGSASGGTIAISGTDTAGVITATTGSAPAGGATVCTVTFNVAKPGAKDFIVMLSAGSIYGGRDIDRIRVNRSSAGFTIEAHDALNASQNHTWYYHVFEFEA